MAAMRSRTRRLRARKTCGFGLDEAWSGFSETELFCGSVGGEAIASTKGALKSSGGAGSSAGLATWAGREAGICWETAGSIMRPRRDQVEILGPSFAAGGPAQFVCAGAPGWDGASTSFSRAERSVGTRTPSRSPEGALSVVLMPLSPCRPRQFTKTILDGLTLRSEMSFMRVHALRVSAYLCGGTRAAPGGVSGWRLAKRTSINIPI